MPKGKYKRTEKAKRHCRTINVGRQPWNKGKKGTQVAWNKGVPMSEKSKRKVSKNRKGKYCKEEHHCWKGGITPINEKIRKSVEYKLW